eukprot:CAMPEP_0174369988 /NCGR_PEP_ID=MMETSP0811_2-20130205/94516_1 /TAXON_ID=73025 ORGANISM="Eutreptiella gymnastica-like, Strain CCMP1594" /NCGR_SAMPLE_ID=MMETSP0811_2 /ASSEMBLY_ACC=CAM_ASM_000667 /LENGTH=77 /DNA_ID=CAMNT_0015514981 /DNA_START=17 /DNA_END=247 /DNA_ORIENTATION=+
MRAVRDPAIPPVPSAMSTSGVGGLPFGGWVRTNSRSHCTGRRGPGGWAGGFGDLVGRWAGGWVGGLGVLAGLVGGWM